MRLARFFTPKGIRSLQDRVAYALGYTCGPMTASWIRQKWVIFRHPRADIRFGRGTYLGPRFSLFIPDEGSFIVGDGVEFRRDFRAEVSGDGRVIIGSGSVFTYAAVIQCSTSIEIGERCVFAASLMLVDGKHRYRDLTRSMLEQGFDFSPVKIHDDAAIMSKCTVMADVGERAFIGANSVVRTPIPAFSLAVGAPAHVVDYFGPADRGPSE